MFLLVDGNNMLMRAVFVTLNEPIGSTVRVFFKTLKKARNIVGGGDSIVCFDGGKSVYRSALYPPYKANRKTDDERQQAARERLKATIPVLKEYLLDRGIPTIMLSGIEADDVIHKLGRELIGAGEQVVIISNDRDFLQCVQYGMRVCFDQKGEIISTKNFAYKIAQKHFPMNPESFTVFKALTGDKSDNISGLEGMRFPMVVTIIRELEAARKAEGDSVTLEELAAKLVKHQPWAFRVIKNIETYKRNQQLMDLELAEVSSGEVLDALQVALDEVKAHLEAKGLAQKPAPGQKAS